MRGPRRAAPDDGGVALATESEHRPDAKRPPRGDRVKQKIIINADSYETRIAILEDGELAELLVERAEQRRHVGDIYKGRVNAVLPGMQAAFVDLGLPKTGFLHASDLVE